MGDLLDLMHKDSVLTLAERKKLMLDKAPKKGGHAAPPGTGPTGETCGSCVYLVRKQMAKTYLKCALMRAKWTGGGGTDVRARDPACREWDINP